MDKDELKSEILGAMVATMRDSKTPAGAKIAAGRLVAELSGLLTHRAKAEDGYGNFVSGGSADEVRSLELRLLELDALIAEAQGDEPPPEDTPVRKTTREPLNKSVW